MRGTYGYTDANGLYRYVDYVADANGFQATIRSNEPGVGSAQAASTILDAQEPPRAVLELAAAPRRRSGAQREYAASANEYTEIKPLVNERLRFIVPQPSAPAPVYTTSEDSEEPSSSPVPVARRNRFNQ